MDPLELTRRAYDQISTPAATEARDLFIRLREKMEDGGAFRRALAGDEEAMRLVRGLLARLEPKATIDIRPAELPRQRYLSAQEFEEKHRTKRLTLDQAEVLRQLQFRSRISSISEHSGLARARVRQVLEQLNNKGLIRIDEATSDWHAELK